MRKLTEEEEQKTFEINSKTFPYLKHRTSEMTRLAIKKHPEYLKYVHSSRSDYLDLCNLAIQQDTDVIKYLDHKTIQKLLIKKDKQNA